MNKTLRIARNGYKSKATWRGLPFLLTDEQVGGLFQAPCAYCDTPPSNGVGIAKHSGIDRMDNTQGYTPENCVPSCQWCNHAKLDAPVSQFLSWAHRVVDQQDSISSK